MSKVVALLVLLLAVAVAAQAQQNAPSGAPAARSDASVDGPNDVHVHVAKIAHSRAAGSTLLNIENKFAASHSRVMQRLNSVLNRVSEHIQGGKKAAAAALLEVEVAPIVDNTGSLAHTPRVNTTRFPVKAAIDATLVKDAALALLETEVAPIVDNTGSLGGAPRANLTRFSVKPVIDATLVHDAPLARPAAPVAPLAAAPKALLETSLLEVEEEMETENESEVEEVAELEVELEVAPIVDGTGSASHTPRANLTRFSVKPSIDATLVFDAPLAAAAAAKPALPIVGKSFLEVAVAPIVDNTGSLAHTPRVNTTRFPVKAAIDATLVKDAALALLETEAAPIVDGTGSLAQGAPRANLTRFSVKPAIDATLVHDAPLARPAALPVVGKSLLQTRDDCPTCRNRGIKQNLDVVLSPVSAPNSLDQPLIEQQHNAINYLLSKEMKAKLSISQAALNTASSAVQEAADAHERFADFTEKHQNMPLVPQL